MGTAPLDRDIQIELMKTASERHNANIERWKASEAVRQVLRKPAAKQVTEYAQSTMDVKVRCCG